MRLAQAKVHQIRMVIKKACYKVLVVRDPHPNVAQNLKCFIVGKH
jgi:hypothetical protein